MNARLSETISVRPDDPNSLMTAIGQLAEHVNELHQDIGLLSVCIGMLVNAGDRGFLAQPNGAREIVQLLLGELEDRAPLAAMQLRAGLNAPIGTPPPDGETKLTLVTSERKVA